MVTDGNSMGIFAEVVDDGLCTEMIGVLCKFVNGCRNGMIQNIIQKLLITMGTFQL